MERPCEEGWRRGSLCQAAPFSKTNSAFRGAFCRRGYILAWASQEAAIPKQGQSGLLLPAQCWGSHFSPPTSSQTAWARTHTSRVFAAAHVSQKLHDRRVRNFFSKMFDFSFGLGFQPGFVRFMPQNILMPFQNLSECLIQLFLNGKFANILFFLKKLIQLGMLN